jgi:hypothetical protein
MIVQATQSTQATLKMNPVGDTANVRAPLVRANPTLRAQEATRESRSGALTLTQRQPGTLDHMLQNGPETP